MAENSDIWLVIPALNEADNLRWLLPKLTPRYQVIVVDNLSTDETPQVARQLGAQVLSCPVRGYGGAVKTGFDFLLAREQPPAAVVVFDADGTSPFEAIPKVTTPVLANEADMVIGQRLARQRGAMPPHARFGNWLTVTLIRLFTGQSFTEMGPLRALSTDAIKRMALHDPTWGWNVEMQMKAAVLGLRWQEVAIEYKRRVHGKSKISGSIMGSIRAGTRILWSTIVYWREARRLK